MNIEGLETRIKRGTTIYWKDGVLVGRKCTKCGRDKEISEFNFKDKKKGTYSIGRSYLYLIDSFYPLQKST